MFENEKIYFNNSNIKYLFQEADTKCDKLIVIFSGYAANNSKFQHKYNYVKSLQYINCHKLFILDDNGETGSYYMGKKLNFDVETSIISLILDTVTHLGISVEDIISLGSSKGGTAALYYGLKYKFGTIISGAFQTRISDLISTRRPESEEFLLGNKNSEEYNHNYNRLNEILFEQLNSSIKSDIYLMTSENDRQYKNHVLPFLQSLNSMGVRYYLENSDEMKNHSQISIYFPKFFNIILLKILYGINLKTFNINSAENIDVEMVYTINNQDYHLKVISIVAGIEYSHDINGQFLPSRPGYYSTYIVVIDNNHIELYRYLIYRQFNGAGYFDILSSSAEIFEDELHYEIQVSQKNEVNFAYYIYENNELLEFISYQSENSFIRKIDPNYIYKVKCYILSKDGSKTTINDKAVFV